MLLSVWIINQTQNELSTSHRPKNRKTHISKWARNISYIKCNWSRRALHQMYQPTNQLNCNQPTHSHINILAHVLLHLPVSHWHTNSILSLSQLTNFIRLNSILFRRTKENAMCLSVSENFSRYFSTVNDSRRNTIAFARAIHYWLVRTRVGRGWVKWNSPDSCEIYWSDAHSQNNNAMNEWQRRKINYFYFTKIAFRSGGFACESFNIICVWWPIPNGEWDS